MWSSTWLLDKALRWSIAGIVASVVMLGYTPETIFHFYAVMGLSLSVYLFARGELLFGSLFDYMTSKMIAWRWAFVLWAIFSLFWTARGDLAASRAMTLLEMQALGFIFYDASRRLGLARWILAAVFVSATAATLYAMITENPATTGIRLSGLYGNPNALAIVCIIGLAIFCSGVLQRKRAWTLVATYAGSLVLLIGVLASASLKGVAGILSVLFLASWFAGARRRIWTLLAIAAGLMPVILSTVAPLRPYWEYAIQRVGGALTASGTSAGVSGSLVERSRFIRTGASLIAESPMVGRGLETFRWLSGEGRYSHNNFIEIGVALGVVGLVLYYGFTLAVLISAIRARGRDRAPRQFIMIVVPTLLVLDMAFVSYTTKLVSLLLLMLAGWVERTHDQQEVLVTGGPRP